MELGINWGSIENCAIPRAHTKEAKRHRGATQSEKVYCVWGGEPASPTLTMDIIDSLPEHQASPLKTERRKKNGRVFLSPKARL